VRPSGQVEGFALERRAAAYNLGFNQHGNLGATEKVVVFTFESTREEWLCK